MVRASAFASCLLAVLALQLFQTYYVHRETSQDARLASELRAENAALRLELRRDVAALRRDVAALRAPDAAAALRRDVAGLRPPDAAPEISAVTVLCMQHRVVVRPAPL